METFDVGADALLALQQTSFRSTGSASAGQSFSHTRNSSQSYQRSFPTTTAPDPTGLASIASGTTPSPISDIYSCPSYLSDQLSAASAFPPTPSTNSQHNHTAFSHTPNAGSYSSNTSVNTNCQPFHHRNAIPSAVGDLDMMIASQDIELNSLATDLLPWFDSFSAQNTHDLMAFDGAATSGVHADVSAAMSSEGIVGEQRSSITP